MLWRPKKGQNNLKSSIIGYFRCNFFKISKQGSCLQMPYSIFKWFYTYEKCLHTSSSSKYPVRSPEALNSKPGTEFVDPAAMSNLFGRGELPKTLAYTSTAVAYVLTQEKSHPTHGKTLDNEDLGTARARTLLQIGRKVRPTAPLYSEYLFLDQARVCM